MRKFILVAVRLLPYKVISCEEMNRSLSQVSSSCEGIFIDSREGRRSLPIAKR
jgi:hypothetical protein